MTHPNDGATREETKTVATVHELVSFLNIWREKHDLRKSEVRQILTAVLAEQWQSHDQGRRA